MSNSICQDYGPCKKVKIRNFGELTGDWYFISTTPVQLGQNNTRIINDIINNRDVTTYNGSVLHNPNCTCDDLELSKNYKKVVDLLEEKNYIVAIYDNQSELFGGQPIAICINPVVTFVDFPDHPHLNSAGHIRQTFVPPSICYTDDVQGLGSLFGNRIYDAMHYITIWLYRHQIYKLYEQLFMKHKWIGNEVNVRLPNSTYFQMLDPYGSCHCGSKKKYNECCLQNDSKEYVNIRNGSSNNTYLGVTVHPMKLKSIWEKNFRYPEESFIKRLNKEYYRN